MSSISLASVAGQALTGIGGPMSVPDRLPTPLVQGYEAHGRETGTVTLRVSGSRPLRLRGRLLAEASSWSAGTPAWHEVALYQRESGDMVVALRTCSQPGGSQPDGESDACHARPFASLADAASWLGGFNPTADLPTDLDASDRRLSGVEIALRAAALRQRADRVERQYKAMIGELLFCLEEEGILERNIGERGSGERPIGEAGTAEGASLTSC
jgi:hypothetical protein